jgi:hypothetical protein
MPAEDQSQNGNPPWRIARTYSGQSCTMGDSGHSHCGICHSATFIYLRFGDCIEVSEKLVVLFVLGSSRFTHALYN